MDKECIESMQQLIDTLKQQIHNLKDELDMAHTHINKLQQLLHNKNALLSYHWLTKNDNECNTVEHSNRSSSHHKLSISTLLSSCGTAEDYQKIISYIKDILMS